MLQDVSLESDQINMSMTIQDLAASLASTPQAVRELPVKIREHINSYTNNNLVRFAALTGDETTIIARQFLQAHGKNLDYK